MRKNTEGAGTCRYTGKIFYLPPFDFAVLGLVVCIRKEFANGGDAGPSLGHACDSFRIESVLEGPPFPDTSYGGG